MGTQGRNWTIDRSDADNYTMRARVSLRPGDDILDEAVLAYLDVGLLATYDQNQFFDPNHGYSGSVDAAGMRNELTPAQTRVFDSLRSDDRTPLNIMSKNAFAEPYKKSGLSYQQFFIYKTISRINHSCRPNAVVIHPEGRLKRGMLRAIRHIGPNDEILIDYMSTVEAVLRSAEERSADLIRDYGFACSCVVCGDTPANVAQDDQRRNRALLLYNRCQDENVRNGETAEQALRRRIRDGREYAELLHTLRLKDHKLCEAYSKLSELEEETAKAQIRFIEQQGQNTSRANRKRPCDHLDSSLSYCEKALENFNVCSGPEHKDAQESEFKMRKLRAKKMQHRRPSAGSIAS